jgi:hypothetical protein
MAYGRGTGAGGSNAYIYVDASDALEMLLAIDVAISPLSMSQWLYREMSPFLNMRARARFANEGDETVGNWAPLKEATQDIRESMGYGRDSPINKRTGELENFITGGGNDVSLLPLGAVLTMPGSAASNSELEDKLATAQAGRGFGGPAPSDPHTVPRPVLGLGGPDLEFALVGLNNWVHTLVAYRGGKMTMNRT